MLEDLLPLEGPTGTLADLVRTCAVVRAFDTTTCSNRFCIVLLLDIRQFICLFVWLISHQPAVLFSHNKSATNNQPVVLFSQNRSASEISHQQNEQAGHLFRQHRHHCTASPLSRAPPQSSGGGGAPFARGTCGGRALDDTHGPMTSDTGHHFFETK
jgi:hypothetical protein